jgi:signal transduction histidine kinase
MDIFSFIGIVFVLLMFGTILLLKTAEEAEGDERKRDLAQTKWPS